MKFLLDQPDWEETAKFVESGPRQSRHRLWSREVQRWAKSVADTLGRDYSVTSSTHLVLCSAADADRNEGIHRVVEHIASRLKEVVPNADACEFFGPELVFELSGVDDASRLVDVTNVEDLEWGVGIDEGYRFWVRLEGESEHVVSPLSAKIATEQMEHLELPLWVIVGLRTNLENEVLRFRAHTPEVLAEQRDVWTPQSVQGFWSGASFIRDDCVDLLSGVAATLFVRALMKDASRFSEFLLVANYRDGGAAALQEVYEYEPATLFEPLVGRSDLGPDPARFTESYTELGFELPSDAWR